MIKGGQQFFSNYLKAFKETVDKLSELIRITEATIPKFSIVSDNIKETIISGETYPQATHKMKMYFTGQIKVTFDSRATDTVLYYLRVRRNGTLYQTVNIKGTTFQSNVLILPINEGDEYEFLFESNAPQYVKIKDWFLKYDLVDNPIILVQ